MPAIGRGQHLVAERPEQELLRLHVAATVAGEGDQLARDPRPQGAIVISRDLLLVLVAMLIMLTGGQLNPTPSWLGKASTVGQMLTVGVALLVVGVGHDYAIVRKTMLVAAAVLTVASGIQYLLVAPRYVDWGVR